MPVFFALTMFVSATLLFLVQPMVGKMMLPLLGGTPAVWNTCMVFFQALLLAGYYYSHKGTTLYAPRRQTRIHMAVLGACVIVLAAGAALSANNSPIPVVKLLAPQGQDYPFFGVIALLTVAIALPFFAVSTSAPLLQKWFAYTGHPSSRDPYFLYGASNLGSLLALVAYPTVVEPNLKLVQQAWVWALGFGLLMLMTWICARMVLTAPPPKPVTPTKGAKPQPAQEEPPPTLGRILRWMGLAFVPSSMMLSVTTFVSTDIASLPLLWIIPLSLYLITFIIAFSRMPAQFHLLMTLITPVLLLLLVFLNTSGTKPDSFLLIILLHMLTFFAVAMVCHGELARNRPATKYLTTFYLTMSVGGMLGGMFNSLIAPIVFNYVSEYPITMVAACLLLPQIAAARNDAQSFHLFGFISGPRGDRIRASLPGLRLTIYDLMIPLGIFALCRFLVMTQPHLGGFLHTFGREIVASILIYGGAATACVFLLDKRPRFRIALAAALGAAALLFVLAWRLIIAWYERIEDTEAAVSATPLLVGIGAVLAVTAGYVLYWRSTKEADWKRTAGLGVAAIAACLVATWFATPKLAEAIESVSSKFSIGVRTVNVILVYGIPAMLCYFFVEKPLRFGLSVAALLLASFVAEIKASKNILYLDRSFFGTLKVEESTEFEKTTKENYSEDSPFSDKDVFLDKEGKVTSERYYWKKGYNRLVHGTTLHGKQAKDAEKWAILGALTSLGGSHPLEVISAMGAEAWESWQFPGRDPLTYYVRSGPVGHMFNAWREKEHANTNVACIGLGTGSLSSYGLPGQKMTFFEIDTAVRRIVETPRFFTYIDSARRQGVPIEFVMGDARLELEDMKDRKFGFMLVDAFSSDAIPVHLLTEEAVRLYFDRVEDDGIVALHISNRYLDLEPVVERIARQLKLEARVLSYTVHRDTQEDRRGWTSSTWIALAKTPKALGRIEEETQKWIADGAKHHDDAGNRTYGRWTLLLPNEKVGLWTDNYSPIKSVLKMDFKLWQ